MMTVLVFWSFSLLLYIMTIDILILRWKDSDHYNRIISTLELCFKTSVSVLTVLVDKLQEW